MRERFEGEEGRRRLIESLRTQTIVEGNEEVAKEIAVAATLEEYPAAAELITQHATDNDVFFILSGSVAPGGR
jgi:CRP/FNR family transcriptional regulator, cyclic AMP receptor protein